MTKVEETLEAIAGRLEDLFGLYAQLGERQGEFEKRVGDLLTGVKAHLETVEATLERQDKALLRARDDLEHVSLQIGELQEAHGETTEALPKIYERVSSLGHKAEASDLPAKTTIVEPDPVSSETNGGGSEAMKELDADQAISGDQPSGLALPDLGSEPPRGVTSSVYGG